MAEIIAGAMKSDGYPNRPSDIVWDCGSVGYTITSITERRKVRR